METKFTFDKKWIEEIKSKSVDLWMEEAAKKDIAYIKLSKNAEIIATPADEDEAMLRQFGSATRQIPAEFWVEKTRIEWEKRMKKENLDKRTELPFGSAMTTNEEGELVATDGESMKPELAPDGTPLL